MTKEAAAHNSAIIANNDYDFTKTLEATSPGTQLAYGSEFRPAKELEPIFHHHELWDRTNRLLQQGSTIPLLSSNPTLDKEDVKLGLERGNHKGAAKQPELLNTLVTKDVTHGFALPITMEAAANIKKQPMGTTQYHREVDN